jgi:hypothetical protein
MILPGTVPQDGLSAARGLTLGGILTPLSAPEFLFVLDGNPPNSSSLFLALGLVASFPAH